MNDCWPEIVETVAPYLDEDTTREQFLMAVKAVMRILRWRHGNGSMRTNHTFKSKNAPDVTVDIVLKDRSAVNVKKGWLPVMVVSPSVCFDDSVRQRLKSFMNAVYSTAAVCFCRDIRIFIDSEETGGISLAIRADYDPWDVNGPQICNLLTYQNFSMASLCAECVRARVSTARQELRERLKAIIASGGALNELTAFGLESEGFAPRDIYTELSELGVSCGYRGQNSAGGTTSALSPGEGRQVSSDDHDSCRFRLGREGAFTDKGTFALNVIRRYVSDHPEVSYDDLENQFFPGESDRQTGVVLKLSDAREMMKTNPDSVYMYSMRPEEIITLNDGTEIVVRSQWNTGFPEFLKVARQLYDVRSDRPYLGFEDLFHDGQMERVKSGICISPSSLEEFRKRHQ